MENYSNLIEAIKGLKEEGYTEDFNLKQNCLECRNGDFKVFHDEFIVDKYYRFEADTNPTDQSIIYAISSEKHDIKGILINGYGVYSDPLMNEMVDALKIK